jgi:DNA repair protein SbcC/Rad50
MRLHTLTLAAFGPFADAQQVDFDALGDAGLFLFHGPTGAGKTSILDAVCFAFYGQVPGARQQARTLRSDHAAPGVRPEVMLEATVRGRRLRVTRSPQWDRPKQRGSGTTTEQARVLLEEHDRAGWRTLSTRLDETGQLLGRLLGLSMGQFCQVALLPQGQFAEFLRADADRRRALLETLFDTERFAAVEAWLVDQRRGTARALGEVDQDVAGVLARLAEAADLAAVPAGTGPEEATAWVAELIGSATAALRPAAAAERLAREGRDGARAAATEAEALHAVRLRHRELAARRERLQAEEPARVAAVAELDAARRAAPVVPLWSETVRLEEALAQAVGQAQSHSRAVAPFLDGDAGAEAGALRRQVAAVRAEVGGLGRLAADEDEASRLAGELDNLERSVVALDAEAEGLAEWLDTAKATREQLEAALEDAARADAQLPAVQASLAAAEARLAGGRRRDELAHRLAELRQQLSGLVDAAQVARAHWLDLRQSRLDGMAAELAAALVPGEACPVCGSGDHPVPAAAGPDAVGREQEALAEAAAERADAGRTATAAALTAAELALVEARAAAGGDTPVDELNAAWTGAQATAVEVTARAGRLPDAGRAIKDFEAEHDRRLQLRMRLSDEARGMRERVALTGERLAQLGAQLAAARGADPSVRARAERLARLADDCDALAQVLADAERLRGEVDAARERARVAATEQGLADLDVVAAAARDPHRVAALEEFRARLDAEQTSLDEQLGDPGMVAAAAAPAPDLAGARAEVQRRDAAHQEAVGALHTATRRVEALERLDGELAALLAQRAPIAERHRVVDALSRLTEGKSGDNRLRMSLSAYVLAARLEQVAAAASGRLQRMSSGRYSLLHTAEAGGARGRGGLHLRVLDAWTGAERDPSTLSGGESFSASLALALGLADVVTSEAGGSLLETLFVDEGFGSLDDETLDEVMGVLDGLRDGGRVVGIVSHVADLRQRIPVQLRVEKGRAGSVVRQ